jgi:heme/copper-type cytochrome/quinol oxidase subunit 1
MLEQPRQQPRRRAAVVMPLLGLAAVVVGSILVWTSADDVGWFAYAPLSNQIFTGNGATFLSQGAQAGLTVAVLGLLLLAFWAGYRIGRQRAGSGAGAGRGAGTGAGAGNPPED